MDSGFRGGEPTPKGAPTYYLTNFSPKKLRENEEILAQGDAFLEPWDPLLEILTLTLNVLCGHQLHFTEDDQLNSYTIK